MSVVDAMRVKGKSSRVRGVGRFAQAQRVKPNDRHHSRDGDQVTPLVERGALSVLA